MAATRTRGWERRTTASGENRLAFESVVERALDGDSAAFETIYNRYAGRVRAFAATRGADDPEAIANDVMLRAFRNLGSFAGDEGQFVRWIFTIARNRLIDAHRSAERRPSISDAEVPERLERSAESIALDASTSRVVELLAGLTLEQREVIALRMIEDLSIRDVAAIVERPVTAVKALQRRGLRTLQKKILDQAVS